MGEPERKRPKLSQAAGEAALRHSRVNPQPMQALLVAAAVLATSGVAYSQGFMVKPMSMEFTPRAGQTVEKALQLRNTTADHPTTLLIRAFVLGQTSAGSWQAIDPANEKVDTSHLRSCYDWVGLSADSVDIAPMEVKNVTVRLKVPHGVRGFYGAALLVQTKPEAPRGMIALVIRFLIPVRVRIQGPPPRERIDLADVGMQHVGESEKHPPTTEVSLQVNNDGQSFGGLGGSVTVLRQAGERWQRVAEAEIRERGIIPGVTLNLTEDLGRRLPSGRYKLQAALQVGGRLKGRLEREIDFEGDPTISTLAADVPLMLQPPTVSMKAVPASTRSAVLTVQNPSAEAVRVACGLAVPPGLTGVAMGSVTGNDFTCAEWTEVYPASFTLAAGGQRNIRITVKFPHTESPQANYYADLHLKASYPDGQSGGETQAMIWVQNPKAESEATGQPISLMIAEEQEDKYAVTAQFGNVGNVHFTPTAAAALATPIGSVVAREELETTAGRVLPLGTPRFSGVIDFADVPPGGYILTATMKYADKETSKKLPIRVEMVEGRKVVTVIEKMPAEAEAPESSSVP